MDFTPMLIFAPDSMDRKEHRRVKVGPGCFRTDLPSPPAVRAWLVEIAPGCQWPNIDEHDDFGELVYVISGELIEDDVRFPAGTYIFYHPNSHHQPRSEHGVQMFGVNVAAMRT